MPAVPVDVVVGEAALANVPPVPVTTVQAPVLPAGAAFAANVAVVVPQRFS